MPTDTFALQPVLPILQVVAFTLLTVGLAVWLYWREERGNRRVRLLTVGLAVLRAMVVAATAALLLNPTFIRAEREIGKPPLLVLLDSSHSMAVRDAGGERRFDVAKRMLLDDPTLLSEYQKHFTPLLFSVAESATRQELNAFRHVVQPNGSRTDLGAAIAHAFSAAPGAASGGLLLLSDGRNHGELSPVEVAKQAKARRFPVYTICLGTTARGHDVSLVNRRIQVYAAPEQEVPLTAEVRSVGYTGRTAQVQLLKEGRVLASKAITLDDARPAPVSFPVKEARKGAYRYVMAVRPMPGEGTNSNNRSTTLLRVLDSRIRVLVLEARPTWDAKFLIQALHTDPSIDLDAIFKLTESKFFAVKGAVGPASGPVKRVKVPSTPAELSRYDVIIIGKGCEEFFRDAGAKALKQYVADHAGNLILLRGNPEERGAGLQALEPVRWSEEQIRDFRMQLTEEGKSHPAFSFRANPDAQTVIQKLPTLLSATRVQGEKALAVVLARAGTSSNAGEPNREMAVLAYQNYGQGKVVALVGQGLWRWAFLPPELKDYATCYEDFWTQLIRWLVSQSDFLPGQEVSLRTDRTSYSPGDTVHLLAFARGKGAAQLPPLQIVAPDGRVSSIRLGKAGGAQADFTGSFRPTQPGEYLASLSATGHPSSVRGGAGGEVMVPFTVYQTGEEDIITAADPDLMRRIAQAGGGELLTLRDLKELPQKLRDAQSLLTTRTEPRPAWDRAWVLAAILGVLSLEWVLRRRMGWV